MINLQVPVLDFSKEIQHLEELISSDLFFQLCIFLQIKYDMNTALVIPSLPNKLHHLQLVKVKGRLWRRCLYHGQLAHLSLGGAQPHAEDEVHDCYGNRDAEDGDDRDEDGSLHFVVHLV